MIKLIYFCLSVRLFRHWNIFTDEKNRFIEFTALREMDTKINAQYI